jgi:uncharacterized membrane protein SirB2
MKKIIIATLLAFTGLIIMTIVQQLYFQDSNWFNNFFIGVMFMNIYWWYITKDDIKSLFNDN